MTGFEILLENIDIISIAMILVSVLVGIIALLFLIYKIIIKKRAYPVSALIITFSFLIAVIDVASHELEMYADLLAGYGVRNLPDLEVLHPVLHILATVFFLLGVYWIGKEQGILVRIVREKTNSLHKAVDKLRSLDRLKTKFVQNAAHDLKTPLSIAITAQGLIKTSRTKKDRKKFSVLVERNLNRLRDSIENMLELYKIEAGRKYLKEPMQLSDIIRAVAVEQEPIAKQKKLGLKINVRPMPTLFGDAAALRIVVENLLENAIKYTEKGTITVTAATDKDRVSVSVEDTGKGIPLKDQEHIFERFYKADLYSPGAGIGLAITKHIIEAHGGKISFKSTPDKGSVFTFTLPIKKR